jgi:hypothetical protein
VPTGTPFTLITNFPLSSLIADASRFCARALKHTEAIAQIATHDATPKIIFLWKF